MSQHAPVPKLRLGALLARAGSAALQQEAGAAAPGPLSAKRGVAQRSTPPSSERPASSRPTRASRPAQQGAPQPLSSGSAGGRLQAHTPGIGSKWMDVLDKVMECAAP
jgi:hypothetical protein